VRAEAIFPVTLRTMKPRVRQGEIVRILHFPEAVDLPGDEGVVEEVTGPNDEGTGWNVTVRLGGPPAGADALVQVAESDLQATGLAENERGEPVPLADQPAPEEPRDCLELRLFTEITDGIDARRVAETIEAELADLLGAAAVSIVAERHWSEPYNYELGVTIHPSGSPTDAVRAIAEAGGDGWLACRDDGWRFDLWWSHTRDDDAMLLVPEVHGAELTFLPWGSPARRPEEERPLVEVVPGDVGEPEEPDYEEDDEADEDD
jgi:hypothetical protein